MHVCIIQFSLVFSLCLIPTTTIREHRQGVVVTGGGLSRVLRRLADASESANQCDLETEHGTTNVMPNARDDKEVLTVCDCSIWEWEIFFFYKAGPDPVGISMAIEALVHTMQPVMVHHSVDMSIRSLFV